MEVDRFVSCVVLSTIGEDNRLATYPQDLSQCDFSFFQNLKKDDQPFSQALLKITLPKSAYRDVFHAFDISYETHYILNSLHMLSSIYGLNICLALH